MTDPTSWQPPAGAQPPAAPSPYSSPEGAAPTPAAQPGWTPPPKPGLIPLRPLTLGTLLGAAFQVMRRNPRPTFGFSLLVTGIIYVVTVVIIGAVTFFALSRVQFATGADADAIAAGAVGTIILSALVPVALSIVGSAILQGVIALEVARATLGEKLRLPGLWRAARGRIGALIGWSGIISAVVLVAITIAAGAIALLVAVGGVAGIVVGVLLGILFAAAGVAAAVWLGTKLALVPTILMLERLRLADAVRRSWNLTRGVFWRTFGILVLVYVIIQVATSIITTPLNLVAGFVPSFLAPNGGEEAALVTVAVVTVVSLLVALVFGAIAAIVQSSTPALLYIDIRMRKEGLDLELARFVEARQAGDASVRDPYLVAAAPAAPGATASTSPWS